MRCVAIASSSASALPCLNVLVIGVWTGEGGGGSAHGGVTTSKIFRVLQVSVLIVSVYV